MQLNKNLLQKIDKELILFTITFLFFFELVGTLIESIYMLDLLNLELDEKVLGVLFLLSPFLLIIFRKKISTTFPETMVTILVVFRIVTPLLNTSTKIATAGIGVAAFLLYFSSYFSGKNNGSRSIKLGAGLASAVLLSIMFRALYATIDISMYGWFQSIGWVLGGVALFVNSANFFEKKTKEITSKDAEKSKNPEKETESKKKVRGIISLSLALTSILILNYFVFSSPAVISRWINGNYIAITISIMIMIILSILLLTLKPELLNILDRKLIWVWNLLFILSLVLTIVVHWFPFPSQVSGVVTISYPLPWYYYIPLGMMIGLLPIIFIDFALLSKELFNQRPNSFKLGFSFGLSGLFFILVALILIFTNVWGYVDPVSTIFRNLFFLSFLLVGTAIGVPIILVRKRSINFKSIITTRNKKIVLSCFLGLIMLGTILPVVLYEVEPITSPASTTSLRIMTYNIQQGVDSSGEKAYEKQLEVIKSVNPDIIGLQESDTARISGGNSDVVRYFASRLPGYYYSFYGPRTTTGTYGTAILSRYPITNKQVFFTYSNVDEIGTTQVVISVGGTDLTVFVNHPAGNDDAKLAHMNELMRRVNNSINNSENVISMGDFNTKENSTFYNMSVATLVDSWRDDNPSTLMPDRIDYIFVDNELGILETGVIEKPQSYSDHDTYWTEISLIT